MEIFKKKLLFSKYMVNANLKELHRRAKSNGYVTIGDMEGFLGIEQRRISDCLTDNQIYPGIIEASDFEKYISNLHRRISTAPVGVLNQPLPLMYVEDQPIMIRVGDDVNRGNSFVS